MLRDKDSLEDTGNVVNIPGHDLSGQTHRLLSRLLVHLRILLEIHLAAHHDQPRKSLLGPGVLLCQERLDHGEHLCHLS
jgi:hypothetical protein